MILSKILNLSAIEAAESALHLVESVSTQLDFLEATSAEQTRDSVETLTAMFPKVSLWEDLVFPSTLSTIQSMLPETMSPFSIVRSQISDITAGLEAQLLADITQLQIDLPSLVGHNEVLQAVDALIKPPNFELFDLETAVDLVEPNDTVIASALDLIIIIDESNLSALVSPSVALDMIAEIEPFSFIEAASEGFETDWLQESVRQFDIVSSVIASQQEVAFTAVSFFDDSLFLPSERQLNYWMCERVARAVLENDADELNYFATKICCLPTKYTLFVAEALWEGRWQTAEEPIAYIKAVAQYKSSRQYNENESWGPKNGKLISLDEPTKTGDPLLYLLPSKEDWISLKELEIDLDIFFSRAGFSFEAKKLWRARMKGYTRQDVGPYLKWNQRRVERVWRMINRRIEEYKRFEN